MNRITFTLLLLAIGTILLLSCSKEEPETKEVTREAAPVVLASFPLDAPGQVLTSGDVTFDSLVSADGNGSIRVQAVDSTTVRLFELDSINLDSALLVYQARVRCEDLEGDAYLDMLCTFPEMGEFFSRNVHLPISGTVDWVSMETPFRLLEGQNPERVSLNLVVTGPGTVWIDDIRLIRRPLSDD